MEGLNATREDGNALDELAFEQAHSELGKKAMNQIHKQLACCQDQRRRMDCVFAKFDCQHPAAARTQRPNPSDVSGNDAPNSLWMQHGTLLPAGISEVYNQVVSAGLSDDHPAPVVEDNFAGQQTPVVSIISHLRLYTEGEM